MENTESTIIKCVIMVCVTFTIISLGGCQITEYYFNQDLKTGHHEQQQIGKEGTIWVPDSK